MPDGIRDKYSQLGVNQYYEKNGTDYRNPHFKYVRQLLINNQDHIDYSRALDFCCGSGEVTEVLAELGYKNTSASDPFTQQAFQQNIGQNCYGWAFDDVIKGQVSGDFSAIICSFAMHLCDEKKLYPLVTGLFQMTDTLVIITPHKRPDLSSIKAVQLTKEDFVLTERGKQVRLRIYN